MGRLDDELENSGSGDSTAESILRTVTQDLKSLQQDVMGQLTQDIKRLKAEKALLTEDVRKLRAQQQALQSQNQVSLSHQQIAQQQLWAKQLAQALAAHLQTLLVRRLNQVANAPQTYRDGIPAANGHNENAYKLLASLDATLNKTFKSLQHDLNSYQSSLSLQINRMHNVEQQGEAILEALVKRLSEQLQAEANRIAASPPVEPPSQSQPPDNPPSRLSDRPQPSDKLYRPEDQLQFTENPRHPDEQFRRGDHQDDGTVTMGSHPYTPESRHKKLPPQAAIPIAPEPPAAAPRVQPRVKQLSQIQVGLLLVLLSSVTLSVYNVILRIILNRRSVLGLFEMGGLISPSLGNSLLILWMRMLVVVPLMAFLAAWLYRPVWRDIKKFSMSKDKRLLINVVGSGFFLFLSQVLIYIAFGQIPVGVAVTILFMYPLITVPLAWILFGDRPTQFRIGVMLTICLGVVLVSLSGASSSLSQLGVGAAAGSGIAFAGYVILTQICSQKLHPVPFSLINFATIFVLASLSLIVLPTGTGGVSVDPKMLPGLLLAGLVLGAATLVGYLLNNFGIRLIGAARASIVGSSGPAITAILAFLIIQEALQVKQIVGLLLVTLGVAALSLERMRGQAKTAQPTK